MNNVKNVAFDNNASEVNSLAKQEVLAKQESERVIWDKLSEYIFGSFEIDLLSRGQFQNFQTSRG